MYCPINNIEEITFTKRKVLSFIDKIYDPLGFLGPIITNAKIIMQRICRSKISWDETLPPDLYDMWKTFAEGLISMPSFEIKRDLNFAEAETTDRLGFCDDSDVTYGCAIYCRVIEKDGSILTNLVCSKSRISAINEKLTIPRAELNSALLIVKVHKILSRFINIVYIFSDSWVVLSWLKLNPYKLNNYVANRVSKINELIQNFKWNYIESNQNPSDLISRGTTPKTLANSRLWWKGPEFLTQPHLSILMQSDIESLENIPEVKSYVATAKAEYLPVLTKFSNLQKLQRVIAYVLRFIHNTKNKREKLMRNLTAGELDNSLNMTIKLEQQKHFQEEIRALCKSEVIKTNLKYLQPFLDRYNILRVTGRLQNAKKINYSQKHPIILPKRSHVTNLIIQNEHEILMHAGQRHALASLSQKFWIISAIREIKKNIHKCLTCFKLKAKTTEQLMGSITC
ncbi:hypothetical protein ILUMI_17413 [Ignelater luminosus]|uniref:Integrase zinc-binding domain-containing protein n=1 Tax=Ignelater luminosus TaxID=2038154 RepID=A0A8K0CSC7_IGNLU|nr:hypothetical protein ILUMI_17413 [Ignelater luminosus]